MNRKTVLLDVDGVLCDFVGGVLDLCASELERTFQREQITRFDFAACLGLSAEEKRIATSPISHRAGWWSSLPILPGAQDGVARLMEIAEVYIVTSPWNSCPTWLHEREAWLRKHFDIPHSRVLAGSAKHLVAGDVFIDDKTETVAKWEERWGGEDGRAVQWITPHNRLDMWSGYSTNDWGCLVEWCR